MDAAECIVCRAMRRFAFLPRALVALVVVVAHAALLAAAAATTPPPSTSILLMSSSSGCNGAIPLNGAVYVADRNLTYWACAPINSKTVSSGVHVSLVAVSPIGSWTTVTTDAVCPGPTAGVVTYSTFAQKVVASCGGTTGGSLIAVDAANAVTNLAAAACANIVSMAENPATGYIFFACSSAGNPYSVMFVSSLDAGVPAQGFITTTDCAGPTHLVFDAPTNKLVVSCAGNNRVVEQSMGGGGVVIRATSGAPSRVTVDSSTGNLFFTTSSGVYSSLAGSTTSQMFVPLSACSNPLDVWVNQPTQKLYVSCPQLRTAYGAVKSVVGVNNTAPATRLAMERCSSCTAPMARHFARWAAPDTEPIFSSSCSISSQMALIGTTEPLYWINDLPTDIFYGSGFSQFSVSMSSAYISQVRSLIIVTNTPAVGTPFITQLNIAAGATVSLGITPKATGTAGDYGVLYTTVSYVNGNPIIQGGSYYQVQQYLYINGWPMAASAISGVPTSLYPGQPVLAMWSSATATIRQSTSITVQTASGIPLWNGTALLPQQTWLIPAGYKTYPLSFNVPTSFTPTNDSLRWTMEYDSQFRAPNATTIYLRNQDTLTVNVARTAMACGRLSFPIQLVPSSASTGVTAVNVSFVCDNSALNPPNMQVTIPVQSVVAPVEFKFPAPSTPTSCTLQFAIQLNGQDSYQWAGPIADSPSISFATEPTLTVGGFPATINSQQASSVFTITPSGPIDADFDLSVSFSLAGVTDAPSPIHFTAGSSDSQSFTFTAPQVSTSTPLVISYSRSVPADPNSLVFLAPDPTTIAVVPPAYLAVSKVPSSLFATQRLNFTLVPSGFIDVSFVLNVTLVVSAVGGEVPIAEDTSIPPIAFTAGSVVNGSFSFLAPVLPQSVADGGILSIRFDRNPPASSPFASFQAPATLQLNLWPQATFSVTGLPPFLFVGQLSPMLQLTPSSTINNTFQVKVSCAGACSFIQYAASNALFFAPPSIQNSFQVKAAPAGSAGVTTLSFAKSSEPQYVSIPNLAISVRDQDQLTLSGLPPTRLYTNSGPKIVSLSTTAPLVYPLSVSLSISGPSLTTTTVGFVLPVSPANQTIFYTVPNLTSGGTLRLTYTLNSTVQFQAPAAVALTVTASSQLTFVSFPTLVYLNESALFQVRPLSTPNSPVTLNLSASGVGGTFTPSSLTWTTNVAQDVWYNAPLIPNDTSGIATITSSVGSVDGQFVSSPPKFISVQIRPQFIVSGRPSTLSVGQIATITLTPSLPPSVDVIVDFNLLLSTGVTGALNTSTLTFTANSTDAQSFTITANSGSGVLRITFNSSAAAMSTPQFPLPATIAISVPASAGSSTGQANGASTGQASGASGQASSSAGSQPILSSTGARASAGSSTGAPHGGSSTAVPSAGSTAAAATSAGTGTTAQGTSTGQINVGSTGQSNGGSSASPASVSSTAGTEPSSGSTGAATESSTGASPGDAVSSSGALSVSSTGTVPVPSSAPPALVTFTLSLEVSSITDTFKSTLLAALCKFLDFAPCRRVRLVSVTAGSTIVVIEVESGNTDEPDALALVGDIAHAINDPASSLRAESAFVSVDTSRPATFQAEQSCGNGVYAAQCPAAASSSGSNLSMIIGAIVGGVAALVLLSAAVWYCRSRRSTTSHERDLDHLHGDMLATNPALSILNMRQARSDTELQAISTQQMRAEGQQQHGGLYEV